MQAQLEELIFSMYSALLELTHSPSALSNVPLLLTLDYSTSRVLLAATVTLLPPVMTMIFSKTLSAIKAASPPLFNGDQAQGCQFLTTCKLYIGLHASSFSNLMWTIKWTLLYMNAGHAADLVQEILEDDANMFSDWAAFESWFLSEFTHPNEVQCAALMLEGITSRAALLTHM